MISDYCLEAFWGLLSFISLTFIYQLKISQVYGTFSQVPNWVGAAATGVTQISKCMTNGSSLIIRGDSYHKSVEITRIEMEAWVLNIVP